MKIYEDIEQRTPEWFKLKLGKFSGTDFATVANGRKDTIETLCYKKASEIITGQRATTKYTSSDMERGNELEADARAMFELETGLKVQEVGFVELNEYCGVSPDGLIIGKKQGVEFKCKDYHTHLKFLLEGDNSYKWQLQGSLYVTKYDLWHFGSYNPNFPIDDRLKMVEIYPDKEAFEKLDEGLDRCIDRVKEILEQYGIKTEVQEEVEEPEVDIMELIASIDSPESALEARTTIIEADVVKMLKQQYQEVFTGRIALLNYRFEKKEKKFYEGGVDE